MYIRDWYGADQDDVNGLSKNSKWIPSKKGNMPCLNAFFWLQHHHGYKPFETEIVYESIDIIE